jgi:hypothetical protein
MPPKAAPAAAGCYHSGPNKCDLQLFQGIMKKAIMAFTFIHVRVAQRYIIPDFENYCVVLDTEKCTCIRASECIDHACLILATAAFAYIM